MSDCSTHAYDLPLRECPFCGGEAYHYAPGPIEHHIACKNYKECGADIERDTEAEAIAAWNSRAERTCKQEERGWGTEGDHARVWLTCGHDCMVPTVQDLPNYCPNCGARVVE